MANDWNLKRDDITGPNSGKELEGSMIRVRQGETGTFYEFLAVVARTQEVRENEPLHFPAFAYNGLVWNLSVDPPYTPGQEQITGHWHNNKRADPADEDGTYTAQAGSGMPGEDDGKEDAASAYA